MAMAGGSREMLTYGAEDLAWGDDLLAYGAPVTDIPVERAQVLLPEQIIVAAARSIQAAAFPVFEKGGEPTLPSVVYSATGVTDLEAFQRQLTEQTFAVICRHKDYGELVMFANAYYTALRRFPGNRIRGVSGFVDGYADAFEFRTRTLTVAITR